MLETLSSSTLLTDITLLVLVAGIVYLAKGRLTQGDCTGKCPYEQAFPTAATEMEGQASAEAGLRLDQAAARAEVLASLGLTPKETEVALLILEGDTTADISRKLQIAPRTVQHHTRRVVTKANVGSRGDFEAFVREETQRILDGGATANEGSRQGR